MMFFKWVGSTSKFADFAKVSPKSFLQIITSMKFHGISDKLRHPCDYNPYVAMTGLKANIFGSIWLLTRCLRTTDSQWYAVGWWDPLLLLFTTTGVCFLSEGWFGRVFCSKYHAARRWLHSYIMFFEYFWSSKFKGISRQYGYINKAK